MKYVGTHIFKATHHPTYHDPLCHLGNIFRSCGTTCLLMWDSAIQLNLVKLVRPLYYAIIIISMFQQVTS